MPKRAYRATNDHAKDSEVKAALRAMAKHLRRMREERGWTRAEFARQVGCSWMLVWHVEQGHNFPSFPVYYVMCRALGVGKPPIT